MVYMIRTRGLFIENPKRLSHWASYLLAGTSAEWTKTTLREPISSRFETPTQQSNSSWRNWQSDNLKSWWVGSKLYHLLGLFSLHPAYVENVKVTFTETLPHLSTCSYTLYLSPFYYFQNVSIIYPTTDVEIERIVICVHRRPCFVSWSIVNKSNKVQCLVVIPSDQHTLKRQIRFNIHIMPTYAILPLLSSIYSKNVWAAKQFPNKHLGRSHQRTTNDERVWYILYSDIWDNLLDFHIYNFFADDINISGMTACWSHLGQRYLIPGSRPKFERIAKRL